MINPSSIELEAGWILQIKNLSSLDLSYKNWYNIHEKLIRFTATNK